jgi:hypothetical protein
MISTKLRGMTIKPHSLLPWVPDGEGWLLTYLTMLLNCTEYTLYLVIAKKGFSQYKSHYLRPHNEAQKYSIDLWVNYWDFDHMKTLFSA